MKHRRVRHHLEGIKEAIKVFGNAIEPIAKQHIISDLKKEGWEEGDPFPKDEQDYVDMGLF